MPSIDFERFIGISGNCFSVSWHFIQFLFCVFVGFYFSPKKKITNSRGSHLRDGHKALRNSSRRK